MPDRPSGLKIDDKLEPGRLLDRQIGRLDAAQQLGELPAHDVSVQLNDQRSVSDEAALLRHFRPLVNGWQTQGPNAVENEGTTVEEKRGCQHVERSGIRGLCRFDGACDFLAPRDLMDRKLAAACARRLFQVRSRDGVVVLLSTSAAIRRTPGTASMRISCRLPSSSEARRVTRVIFPPGWPSERTKPWPTISSVKARIGMLVVACWAARTDAS